MDELYMEVLFDRYCKKCKHCKLDESESPCDECLEEPVNLYSSKPVRFVEDEKKGKHD